MHCNHVYNTVDKKYYMRFTNINIIIASSKTRLHSQNFLQFSKSALPLPSKKILFSATMKPAKSIEDKETKKEDKQGRVNSSGKKRNAHKIKKVPYSSVLAGTAHSLVHRHRSSLADPVNAIARLSLELWVPVHVQQEQVVPTHQVQTHTA